MTGTMHKWVAPMGAMILGLGMSFAGCTCEPEEEVEEITITLQGPMSLTGKYASTCSKTISGTEAAIKWVNETYGGVQVDDATLGKLVFKYADDASEAADVETVTQAACDDAAADFIVAPYSTGLTSAAAAVAAECKKIIMSHGGATDSLYQDNAYIVASIAPASSYHVGILDAIKSAEGGDASGIKVAFAYEESAFAQSIQAAASTYAGELGFTVGYSGNYPGGASTEAEFDTVAAAIIADAPDVVLGGGHAVDGQLLTKVLADQGVAPRAFSLLVSPTDPDFYNLVDPCPAPCDHASHPAEGVSGPSQWEVGVSFSEAGAGMMGHTWFGPSQAEFLDLYHGIAGADQDPSYHAANGAVMVLSLVMAIEKAGTLDSDAVRAAFNEVVFMSFWGHWDIDANGMNVGHEMVEVQWQEGEKQIVWPESGQTADILYPIH